MLTHKCITRNRRTAARAMKEVPASEAKKLVSSGHTYLDVRTPEEFEAGHAEGAKNIPVMFKKAGGMTPNEDFMSKVQQEFPEKEQSMVVGCQSGKRSAMAINKMEEAGYTGLINLGGGYGAWSA